MLAQPTLRYKPEGRGFEYRLCNWNFSLTYSFRPHYVPGVGTVSNIHEYQEYLLDGKCDWCVGLTTLPPSCSDYSEIWKPHLPGILRPVQGCTGITLTLHCDL
jgi:hypothetical protein